VEYYQSLRYGFDPDYDPPVFDDEEETPEVKPNDSEDIEE
jgi:hypothetical protein